MQILKKLSSALENKLFIRTLGLSDLDIKISKRALTKSLTTQVKDEDEAAAVEADWKFAAMVIDRLCLIVYTLFTIIASLTVLWTAPHVIVP